ncbi:lipopolysaccharide biosynthesis protein [Gryllotalpicola daejeonensis]|uniref:Lipopolysaccharide biosynthesis protein n=1 Tax=Gryllotalpicola daejeonensis TaxID=993087 RepID=A0ABP7ZLK9_9MICO
MSDANRSLRSRSLLGGIWTALQRIYGSLLSVVTLALLSRLVGAEDFGIVSLVSVFVGILALVGDLGFTPSLIRASAPSRVQINTAFWTGLAIGTALGAALALAAAPIAAFYDQPQLTLMIRVAALMLPLNALCAIPTVLLTRELKMRPLAIRSAVGASIGAVGAVILALLGAGAWALIFQGGGNILVDIAILWSAVSWRPRAEFSFREAWAMLRFGLPTLATQVVHEGRDRMVELVLGKLLGASALGYWVVATRVTSQLLTLFASVVNAVALPAFSKIRDDRARLQNAVRHAERVCASMAIPGLFAIAAVSPVAVPFLFGGQWATSGQIAQVTAVTGAITALQWLDGNLWWSLGRPGVEFGLVLTISVAHIAAVFFAAPYGLLAVAVALLARTILLAPLRVIALVKIGRMPLAIYRDIPGIALSAGVMLVAMVALSGVLPHQPALLYLVLEAVVGIAVYAGVGLLVQRAAFLELRTDVLHIVRRRAAA